MSAADYKPRWRIANGLSALCRESVGLKIALDDHAVTEAHEVISQNHPHPTM